MASDPWLPDAWLTPVLPAAGEAGAGRADAERQRGAHDDGAFVAGWGLTAARPVIDQTPDTFAYELEALLPDLGMATAARRGANAAGGLDAALAALIAHAVEEREAAVRAELDEVYAADRAAHEAAHAEALDLAWADGHATGRAEGEQAAHAALADAAGTLDAAVREVQSHEERWAGDLRAHVAALAVAVAHHVIGREVAADDALVVALAARVVAEYPAHEALVARVHPADLGALKGAWDSATREGSLRWVPDARMARGGVLVEGRERIVDGRVDAALERLYRAVGGHVA